jgi:hypothetical protein
MKEYSYHPLSEAYPLMPREELDVMAEDMRKNGYDKRFPMIVKKDVILDGRNRYLAARAADCEPNVTEFTGDDAAEERLVIRANENRRHLAPGELSGSRRLRLQRISDARKNGESLRTIAENEEISVGQVQRDLETASGVSGGDTPEPEDGKVTGKDGKKQSAKRKKARKTGENSTNEKSPKADKASNSNSPNTNDDKVDSPTDELGEPIPPGLATIFAKAADFKEIVNQLNAINRKLKELSEHPAGSQLRLQGAQLSLRELKESVHFDMPYCVCPVCEGHAKTRKTNCPCKARGWLLKGQYNNLPTEYRQ